MWNVIHRACVVTGWTLVHITSDRTDSSTSGVSLGVHNGSLFFPFTSGLDVLDSHDYVSWVIL
jgi:hypothetical protein